MNFNEWEAKASHIFLARGMKMFELEGNLKFVNVDLDYLKHLHNACAEVFYKPKDYDNKPYLGVLMTNNGKKYVLPLTSAKEKHKTWKDSYPDRFLVYAIEDKNAVGNSAIFVPTNDANKVKHILSAVDIKKMIPVTDEVISFVDINPDNTDSEDITKYKDLLNKEYSFCVKIVDEILRKASRIYDKQISTGKVQMFACDFAKMESALDEWKSNKN